ncbi:MAG: UvrD-helicase domain-containing protein [Candidatus Pacearchaeota archaeon]
MIEEIKEDETLDYLKILKSLLEIPFPIGKNLLSDFLRGNYNNKSILKNNLDQYPHFDTLSWGKDKTIEKVNWLIYHGLIEETSAEYNNFVKILKITLKGMNEITNPKLNKKTNLLNYENQEVSEKDKICFEKYSEFLKNYNENQKKAIISNENNILTIAGAGSGKTTVLIKRIEFLIKYKNIDPKKILAITFTRKTRQEMQKRLERLNIEDVNVHTFNSFSEDILRKNEFKIYGTKTRVLSYTDKVMAFNYALSFLGLELKDVIDIYFSGSQKRNKTINELSFLFLNDCFSIIDYLKITKRELKDLSKEIKEDEKLKLVIDCIEKINQFININSFRDYTDQIIDTINFFKKSRENIPYFEHVLVDEYQDVNAKQVELLKLLNPKNIFAVGDPRQSIFGWRGSDINFILKFQDDFSQPCVIYLNENYRSKNKIINFMNQSIKEMNLPDLKSKEENSGEIKLYSFNNEEEERIFLLEYLKQAKEKLHQIFILSRTNRQINELSLLLKRNNILHVLKTDENLRPTNIKENHVTLATIHSIKGLEAKTVFVIGCNSINFPCKNSDHPIIDSLKKEKYNKELEELRLFYVAISRAREKLFLTYSGNNHTYFITDEMKKLIN